MWCCSSTQLGNGQRVLYTHSVHGFFLCKKKAFLHFTCNSLASQWQYCTDNTCCSPANWHKVLERNRYLPSSFTTHIRFYISDTSIGEIPGSWFALYHEYIAIFSCNILTFIKTWFTSILHSLHGLGDSMRLGGKGGEGMATLYHILIQPHMNICFSNHVPLFASPWLRNSRWKSHVLRWISAVSVLLSCPVACSLKAEITLVPPAVPPKVTREMGKDGTRCCCRTQKWIRNEKSHGYRAVVSQLRIIICLILLVRVVLLWRWWFGVNMVFMCECGKR